LQIVDRGASIHANRVKALISKMFNVAIALELERPTPPMRLRSLA
jgi:hypothetical protein